MFYGWHSVWFSFSAVCRRLCPRETLAAPLFFGVSRPRPVLPRPCAPTASCLRVRRSSPTMRDAGRLPRACLRAGTVAAAGLLPRSGKRFGFVGRACARSSGAAPRACCLSSAPVLPFAVCRAVIVRRRQYLTRAPTVVLTAARAEVPTDGRKERTWIIGFTKNRRGDGQRKKKT